MTNFNTEIYYRNFLLDVNITGDVTEYNDFTGKTFEVNNIEVWSNNRSKRINLKLEDIIISENYDYIVDSLIENY